MRRDHREAAVILSFLLTMTASASDTSPSPPTSWNQFLQSPAISFQALKPAASIQSSSSSSQSQRSDCSHEYYWHAQLLERWQAIRTITNDIDVTAVDDECRVRHDARDAAGNSTSMTGTETGSGLTLTINYASYILWATFLAEKLRLLLSLSLDQDQFITSHHHLNHRRSTDIVEEGESNENVNSGLRKVGIAIPEGPFLPLYILATHSLNVAVSESWLDLVDDNSDNDNHVHNNEAERGRCQGVIIIPMETDEAPERLKHMLADSQPDVILVAPGKDWERMHTAVQSILSTTSNTGSCHSPSTQSCIQLVDFAQLLEDAWTSLCNVNERNYQDTMEQLWPPECRNDAIDSLRYSHSIQGCFDVARLVAMGVVRLISSLSPNSSVIESLPTSLASLHTTRQLISHIVYTSGTTGKPKGCVSSLASLQNYIRAKNAAHSIDSRSRVLLASAITFDPCFSDILAVCVANATLCIATREQLYSRDEMEDEDEHADQRCKNDGLERYRGLTKLLRQLEISHVLCTPTLWATVEGTPPNNVPSLQIVALGGEPIPKTMIRNWARRQRSTQRGGEWDREYPRLCSTYGVTEACVYQTFGEVVLDDALVCEANQMSMKNPGQCVGLPLIGTNIHICTPHPPDECVDQTSNFTVLKHAEPDASSSEPTIGEIVLCGSQVDAKSSYLNLDVSARVFIQYHDVGASFGDDYFYYRTGDLGYVDPVSGHLFILGRIQGDNMVKINGVRVELSEIEHAIIDDEMYNDEESRLVIDCIASLIVCSTTDDNEHAHKQLVAFCLLSDVGISQLGISHGHLQSGIIVTPGPLMTLLRARCNRQVRKGCTPSIFVLIDRIPLSPNGKRCRSTLPTLANCSIMTSINDKENISLWDSGKAGSIVADAICECLNLQPWQRPLVTLGESMMCECIIEISQFLTNIDIKL